MSTTTARTPAAAEGSTNPPASAVAPLPLATQRLRLLAICAGLVTLVFSQSAGKVAPDTKIDLVVAPLRLLARSLTLWDPTGASGQLQNQGYGYLFPMGPFFLIGHAVALPAWAVQRAWWSLLMVVAFLGAVRLARALGIVEFWPKVAVGLTYALAPRVLSELGSISSELMPVAVLPWVILPLVTGAARGSPRRAAARSGVALLCAGGVNAAATLAILPAPALWLLTREPGPRRRMLMRWWTLAVLLACAWWLVPLLLLGRYSPPFLDWIEPSSLTTQVTSLLASLRGADHWEGYLGPGVWPAGWTLVAAPAVILATAAVAAAGLVGLARDDLPHRRFLRATLLVGLILLTLGHVSSVGPLFAEQFRTWLDGPLNAFRNIHKFDPTVRLALAMGIGHLVRTVRVPAIVRRQIRGTDLEIAARPLAVVAALAVAVVAVAPLVINRIVPQPRTVVEASWWQQAGTWLGDHAGDGRALVVPGSPRPVYVWGSTVDDALQPAAERPWAVRDGVPLAQAGYIRLLDSVEQRLAEGHRDDVLARLLARAGMRYVVVRNDLDAGASHTTSLAVVHATLNNSAGFTRVASFGPDLGPRPSTTSLVDMGASIRRPAVEVFAVEGWDAPVALESGAAAVAASGSGDTVAALVDRGLPAGTPVVFGADAAGVHPAVIVGTDGIRRREASFGQATGASGTMTADQAFSDQRAAYDYLPDGAGPLSTMRFGGGLREITASSSGADPGALLNAGRAHSPWSAVDGDPATSWQSASLHGAVGQWLQLSLDRPLTVANLQIAFSAGLGGYPTRVAVRTDAGTRETDVAAAADPQPLPLPPGPTQTVRITVLEVSPGTGSVGISTLSLPGLTPTRTLVVPMTGTPDMVAFDVDPGSRGRCLTVNLRAACDPSFVQQGEEDGELARSFELADTRIYRIATGVTLRGGAQLDALLDRDLVIRARATSTDTPDPRERPAAAVDGDPFTGWVAGAGDRTPVLTLTLPRPTTVRELVLVTDPGAPVARPTRVRVRAGTTSYTTAVPDDGRLVLPEPVRTRTVRVVVEAAALRLTTDSASGRVRALPTGLSEVRVNGVANPATAAPVLVGCAAGLALTVDGTRVPLQVAADRAAVVAGQPVVAVPCGIPTRVLAAGPHEISLAASPYATPRSVTLTAPGVDLLAPPAPATSSPGTAFVRSWDATRRVVDVRTDAPAMLAVRENFNPGWRASVDGRTLRAVRLDGWQQGFVVPAGTNGPVELRFGPQTTFTLGLVGGLLAALAVVALALVRPRRSDAPPVGERAYGTASASLAVAVVALWLLGVVGLVIVVVLWRVDVELRRVGRELPVWVGGACVAVAGFADAIAWRGSPGGVADSGWIQVLAGAGALFTVSRLAARRTTKSGREYRRSRGRSKPYHDSVPSTVAAPAVRAKYSQ